MMISSSRVRATVAALLVASAVAACGGSSNTSSTGTTKPKTVTVTQTVTTPLTTASQPTPTTTTKKTTTTTATTPATSGTACVAADLTPVSLGSNGAAGTIVYGFALKNSSSTTCHTYGWPGVSFLNASGQMLPTDVTRTTKDVIGTVEPTVINVAPGSEVSFRIVANDAYEGGALCKQAKFLQIYAPDDTVAMRVAISGGAEACGKATVTPLQPGDAAFAGQ